VSSEDAVGLNATASKEVHVFCCAGGRIAEHWGVFDMLGILQQLGTIPA
jgi:hypothetical protein